MALRILWPNGKLFSWDLCLKWFQWRMLLQLSAEDVGVLVFHPTLLHPNLERQQKQSSQGESDGSGNFKHPWPSSPTNCADSSIFIGFSMVTQSRLSGRSGNRTLFLWCGSLFWEEPRMHEISPSIIATLSENNTLWNIVLQGVGDAELCLCFMSSSFS